MAGAPNCMARPIRSRGLPRDKEWRLGVRIFGLVGGEMHGPLSMFVFSYGVL
jgi:hypothetical protein